MFKLGVVIPCYNEVENIISLLEILKKEMQKNSINTKVLVVDDSSPDGTANLVENFIEKENQKDIFEVELLKRPKKSGLASAYIQGLSYLKVNCEYLLEMDADHSHRPIYIPEMLAKLENENYDYAIGSRNIKGGGVENWGWHRKIISKYASLYSRIVLGVPIYDFTGGFNMYKSKVFDKVQLKDIKAEGYLFQIELKYKAYKNDFKFVEIPIIFPDRREGKSKFSKKIIYEAFFGIWKIK
jgi:dolichol-phosphate mannosyltransferase